MLQSIGSQRVRHDLATEQQQQFATNEQKKYNGERIVSPKKWSLENWTVASKRIKLDQHLIANTKTNSKWIKG